MNIIKSNVEKFPKAKGFLGVYKQIEFAARTAYKSEDKITEDSAQQFVEMLKEKGHLAPLEFGTIYLDIPIEYQDVNANTEKYLEWKDTSSFYANNQYSRITQEHIDMVIHNYVTTNLRVIVENEAYDDLKYLCDEPTKYHIFRVPVKVICSRGIANEIVRHRSLSFVQESTRFCNYSKDKFNNQLTFIADWDDLEDVIAGQCSVDKTLYIEELCNIERTYLSLVGEHGWKPQFARDILPLSLKTELCVCGFEDDYEHFFNLRCAETAHPDVRNIANQIKELVYLTKTSRYIDLENI